MEHVIALEWGRFPQQVEVIPEEARKRKGDAESGTGETTDEKARRAALLRLESALALPPEPGMSLYEDTATLPAANAFHPVMQEHPSSPAPSPADQNAAPGNHPAATDESGTYQPRLMWTGMGFEERQVLIVPQTFIDATEPQPAAVLEPTAVESILESNVQPPLTATSSEGAEVASELQSGRIDEQSSEYASRASSPEPGLHADARQLTPPYADSASGLTPSNGSKISQGAQSPDGSRWYVLKGVLSGTPAPEQSPADAPAGNVPVVEVFSLAGGVGKSSLAATLGRALAARGEQVLLVEAASFGSLPYFFGASDCRPGTVRTFRPPASSSDLPIRLASIDPESLPADSAVQDSLAAEIQRWAVGAGRVIVDVATGAAATARALSPMSPMVLVPLVPDINSVLAANSIDSFFHSEAKTPGAEPEVHYLLNQFDPSLPLHIEVAKALHARLGEHLLPFALERDPAVNEALADGMTIVDYAPGSSVAEKYFQLAEWVEQVMAPAQRNSRGTRWSER